MVRVSPSQNPNKRSVENELHVNASDITETFGSALRAIRRARRLTQSELSASMEQSAGYISLIESNQRPPTRAFLDGLKRGLDEIAKPLTSEERHRLDTLAQISDPIAQLRQFARAMVVSGALDEFQRVLLRQGIGDAITGYLDLSKAYQLLNASQFQLAHDQLVQLAEPDGAALPALVRASAGVALADVALKLGNLNGASEAISSAISLIQSILPQHATLEAEALALQGMISLRAGEFIHSRQLFKLALDLYTRADTKGDEDRVVTAIGLTKSYNRLALLALLMGEPQLALSYCDSALEKLKRVSPDHTDLNHPQRLRLVALQAWAHADMGEYETALELRKRCLETYEQRGDRYGIAKTHLYMADDARHELQVAVEPKSELPIAKGKDRTSRYRARLHGTEMRRLVEYAEEHYRTAIEDLTALDERILLSRAHRGLGETLRYKAFQYPESEGAYRIDSRQELETARGQDEWLKQDRLLPSTLISLARLNWDQGLLASARDHLRPALRQLRVVSSSEDMAALEQIEWCERALRVLHDAIGPQGGQSFTQATGWNDSRSMTNASQEWQGFIQRLARAVASGIERNHAQPVTSDSLSVEWTRLLYDIDAQWGPRLVAQEELTSSNERHPQRGPDRKDDDDASEFHIARYHACETRIRDAHVRTQADAYIDICVRQVVTNRINAEGNESDHARRRAAEALRRLKELRNGYRLLVVDEPLPIHVLVKGERALVELTSRASEIDDGLAAHIVGRGSEMCYVFEDPETVGAIKGVFADMRIMAERGSDPESVIAWLSLLLGNAIEAPSSGSITA